MKWSVHIKTKETTTLITVSSLSWRHTTRKGRGQSGLQESSKFWGRWNSSWLESDFQERMANWFRLAAELFRTVQIWATPEKPKVQARGKEINESPFLDAPRLPSGKVITKRLNRDTISFFHFYMPFPVTFWSVSFSLPACCLTCGFPREQTELGPIHCFFLGNTFCSGHVQDAMRCSNNMSPVVLVLRNLPQSVDVAFSNTEWHWEKASEC